MFRGESYHTIDDKGRIIVPARFRSVIAESEEYTLMLATFDGAVYAYTLPQWREIENKILAMAQTSEQFRRFRRKFVGGAFECKLDKQDRVVVPPAHREYADLKGEIAMVGVLDHFEIWSKTRLESEDVRLVQDLKNEEFAGEIAALGL